MEYEEASEISNILQHYQLGELVAYQKDKRGYVNTSYAIETEIGGERRKYFLRRYKQGIRREELVFEHAVIKHLVGKGFDLVARLINTKTGQSYVHLRENGEAEDGVFYAVFEFLLGDDKYTWVNPTCTDEEIKNAANVLARFHNAVFDLIPEGQRYTPEIVDLLPQISGNVVKSLERSTNTVIDAYLLENSDLVQRNINQTGAALTLHACRKLVRLVNHCDYHPGNLKFLGEKVVGLFDFDWSNIDSRCFDVALAIFYFFTDWRGERDGLLQLDRVPLFLKTYQDTLKDRPGVGPLVEAELLCLPPMIDASNLYVLNWTILDCLNKPVEPDEYLVYLKHSVNLIKWLGVEINRRKLARVIAGVEL